MYQYLYLVPNGVLLTKIYQKEKRKNQYASCKHIKQKLMKNLLSGKYTMINSKWVKLFTVTFQRYIFKYATNNIH